MSSWHQSLIEQLKKDYFFDEEKSIWIKKEFLGISYSDGHSIEKKIHEIIKSSKDRGVYSDELRSQIGDWPTEYHLSAARHLVVKPIFDAFGNADTVLEIGSGCGAISRYMSEKCENLVCLEGSIQRAIITAERCKDLKNVTVICDDFFEFKIDVKFDYVTLIGVLEYSNLYTKARDSQDNVILSLKKSNSYLNKNGKLIVAIENQLGLKYFNGCSEDHTNVPFYGINNLYDKNSVITFGRKELKEKLSVSGFDYSTFIYPYPDYKLPRLVVFERAFKINEFNKSDLIGWVRSSSYDNNNFRLFSEKMASDLLIKNGLAEDLANSFIVVAGKADLGFNKLILAINYAITRRSEYVTETKFIENQNEIKVVKNRINNISNIDNDEFSHVVGFEKKYENGRLFLTLISERVARKNDISSLVDSFEEWVNFLKSKSKLITNDSGSSSQFIEGKYWDCIPKNLIIDSSKSLKYIDDEWQVNRDIPLILVLLRGLVITLQDVGFFLSLDYTYMEVFDCLIKKYDVIFDVDNLEEISGIEESLSGAIFFYKYKLIDFLSYKIHKIDLNLMYSFQELSKEKKQLNKDRRQLLRLNNHVFFGSLIRLWRLFKMDPSFAKPQ